MINLKYRIEMYTPKGRCVRVVQDDSLRYLQGWMAHHRESLGVRLRAQLIRERDGRVMEEVTGCEDEGVGMVAGWPSPEQYEAAAERAAAKAAEVRARRARQAKR